MSIIKNIIFDLGGVFIEIDYQKTENAFVELGVINFRQLYSQHNASALFENLETGKITPAEFYDGFRIISGLQLLNAQIETAWNAMLGNVVVENVNALAKIKHRFKIYLFSNTNLIHYTAFQKIFQQVTGKNSFDANFLKTIYSHNLGLRKPYPESFTTIINGENLNAGETLFIDDTLNNIEGAKSAGLQTFLLTKPTELPAYINSIT